MANLLCVLPGVRGRTMEIYDSKCIIRTTVTAGSLLTHNATDGEKTIFYMDCAGVQFKESRFTIGFLQLETPSMQMNNQGSNFFSENTFTFEEGKNGLNNNLMREVYRFVTDRIEGYKYGTDTAPLTQLPDYLAAVLPGNMVAVQPVSPPPAYQQPVYQQPVYQPSAYQPPVQQPAPWKCPQCGNANKENFRFCQGCGHPRP